MYICNKQIKNTKDMKTILQALILFSFISVQAQLTLKEGPKGLGHIVVDKSTVTVAYDPAGSEGVFEAKLESANNNKIRVQILSTTETDPARNFFCDIPGVCYPPSVTDQEVDLLADNTKGFSFHYEHKGRTEDVTIKYRLSEVDASSNAIVFSVKYIIDKFADVAENSSSINKIQAYPNPANQFANIVYDLNENSEMVIYNILGEKIESYQMNRGAGIVKINTANFKSGTYIYQIISESNIKSTKYLIVNH